MATNNSLNLIVIDGDQRYAERIVTLLKHYYDDVNLGFLDDEEEFLKTLRQQWDVLLFGTAYDMSFTDVIGIVQEQEKDLALICLMSDEVANTGRNAEGMPSIIDGNMVKAIAANNETQVVLAVCLAHANLKTKRRYQDLKHILSESELRANILIKNSKSAVAYIDEGIHIFANDPYLEMFGFESMDDIIGVPVIDLISGGDSVKSFKQFLSRFQKGNRDQVEFDFESKKTDGTTFEAKLQLAAATYEGEPVTQIIIQHNNANAEEIAKQLQAAQRKDSLTGLENRQGFEVRLDDLLNHLQQNKEDAALMFVRLDNIGKINSNLGLQGVDSVIKQLAFALDEYFDSAYVSRFNDLTFAVLIDGSNKNAAVKTAEDLLSHIEDMLIEVGKRSVKITTSIGVVMLDKNTSDKQTAIERAMDAINQVMLTSKNTGNDYHVYDPSQYANSDDEALGEYLIEAISHNRFQLLFQPIYDIETDQSNFFEVYLRLPLADGTLMTPAQFMGVAKNKELLGKIDRWVLINAAKQLNQIRKTQPNYHLLIQLTSASLTDSKLPAVLSQLNKAIGGESPALTIQFGEQDIIDYLSIAKKQYNELKQVGCGLCIHNFGMTSKSLETADFVEPNMLRLAKSYVEDLHNDENMSVVKNLVMQANDKGYAVLMPYIEDAATMSVSWSVGARYLQGYYLQAPENTMHISEA